MFTSFNSHNVRSHMSITAPSTAKRRWKASVRKLRERLAYGLSFRFWELQNTLICLESSAFKALCNAQQRLTSNALNSKVSSRHFSFRTSSQAVTAEFRIDRRTPFLYFQYLLSSRRRIIMTAYWLRHFFIHFFVRCISSVRGRFSLREWIRQLIYWVSRRSEWWVGPNKLCWHHFFGTHADQWSNDRYFFADAAVGPASGPGVRSGGLSNQFSRICSLFLQSHAEDSGVTFLYDHRIPCKSPREGWPDRLCNRPSPNSIPGIGHCGTANGAANGRAAAFSCNFYSFGSQEFLEVLESKQKKEEHTFKRLAVKINFYRQFWCVPEKRLWKES